MEGNASLTQEIEYTRRTPTATDVPVEPYVRPEEPKLDFHTLVPLREEVVEPGIRKLLMQQGTSSKTVQSKDSVLYFHETRLANGQLADYNERRK